MKDLFHRTASKVSSAAGSPAAFLGSLAIVVTWALVGPLFDYSNTWQLVINTGTTIVTFLMVFLIQNTQNRDSKAVHLKLDELIHSSKNARNSFVNLENISDEELEELDRYFKEIHLQQGGVKPGIHKLHQKIEAEHDRRLSLRGATQALGNILRTPLNVSVPRLPGQSNDPSSKAMQNDTHSTNNTKDTEKRW
jgi:low affinity Fe/Cu permease